MEPRGTLRASFVDAHVVCPSFSFPQGWRTIKHTGAFVREGIYLVWSRKFPTSRYPGHWPFHHQHSLDLLSFWSRLLLWHGKLYPFSRGEVNRIQHHHSFPEGILLVFTCP